MGGRGTTATRNTNSQTLTVAGRIYTKTDQYVFKEKSLYRNAAAGQFKEEDRPYRVAGDYNLYVRSFSGAALPYSVYLIADKKSGVVYRNEIRQGLGDNKAYTKELVEELKRRTK